MLPTLLLRPCLVLEQCIFKMTTEVSACLLDSSSPCAFLLYPASFQPHIPISNVRQHSASPLSHGPRVVPIMPIGSGIFDVSASPKRHTLNSSSWLQLLSSPGDGRYPSTDACPARVQVCMIQSSCYSFNEVRRSNEHCGREMLIVSNPRVNKLRMSL